jgi:hypothetical protein
VHSRSLFFTLWFTKIINLNNNLIEEEIQLARISSLKLTGDLIIQF